MIKSIIYDIFCFGAYCPYYKRQHLTQQLIINWITEFSGSFVVRYDMTSCPLFMWTKFGLKLQKNLEMRTSGGGGG